MTIRIYKDKISFLADSDNDADIDLLIESDGLRFTKPLIFASNVPFVSYVEAGRAPPQVPVPTQGDHYGLTSGGAIGPGTAQDTIDKFNFSIIGGTATDVGSLSVARSQLTGISATHEGFTVGGLPSPNGTKIDKWPFAITGGTAANIADLPVTTRDAAGHQSRINGFTSGGRTPSHVSQIDKFPFSISSGTATDVGDLSVAKDRSAGASSETDGFAAGGSTSAPARIADIDKFPFSISSGTATDVGNISTVLDVAAGISSTTHGHVAGGNSGSVSKEVFRYSFTGVVVTTQDVGNLSGAPTPTSRQLLVGMSSTSDGFTAGGKDASNVTVNTIDKFPFAVQGETNTDVGDLSVARSVMAGHQD